MTNAFRCSDIRALYIISCLSTNMSARFEVCHYQICADTDQTEKVAIPTRGGTARLETKPSKAVAVLNSKTVSLGSRKYRFIGMWCLSARANQQLKQGCSQTTRAGVSFFPCLVKPVEALIVLLRWISLHVTIHAFGEERLTFFSLQQLPAHVFAGVGCWLRLGQRDEEA